MEHYLPEDVLCKIFSYLDDIDHLKSTSPVCKLFCSVSSPLVHKLTLKNRSLTYSDFQRLFKRFPGVNKIHIKFPKVDNALSAISNSGLNLEKLKLPRYSIRYPKWQTIKNMSTSRVIASIKYLRMDWFYYNECSKQGVIEFAKLFPSLTEFDFTANDERVHELTSKLPNLRKINLGYSHSHRDAVTDKTLDILSSNCPKLETVNFQDCDDFTPEALYKFFCNNPQLSSIVMPNFYLSSISNFSKVVEGMKVLKNLNYLSLNYDIVQDAFLTGLAESRPPLKHLLINSESKRYTMAGLSQLLFACPSLEKLVIHLPYSKKCNTYDAEMSIVVKGLPYLKHIELTSPVVFQATLCSLVNNCPLLEKIRLWCRPYYYSNLLGGVTQVYYCDHGILATPSKKNYSIKLIEIISSPDNSDEWLRSTVESYCPNLTKRKYFNGLVI